MSFTPAPIPTVRQELSFKVVETYEKFLDKYTHDEITIGELDCAVRALIAATGWAVSKDVLNLLSFAETD